MEMSSRFRGSSAAVALALAMFGTGHPAQAAIIKFDPPGAAQTYPVGINTSGWITGSYADSSGNYHGFLRAPDGKFTNIDVPGSGCGTQPYGINRSGAVVGYFGHSGCHSNSGFIRASDGTFTTFDVPGAQNTDAASVNEGGLITGTYWAGGSDYPGYVRATDGTFTSFDAPGGFWTVPTHINKAGVIAGAYEDLSSNWHGFMRATDGTITTFDVPNATYTFANWINDSGEIAGDYQDTKFVGHGFVRMADGTFVTIDPQGNPAGAAAINDRGAVTGSYFIIPNAYGFVQRANGTITTFDVDFGVGTYPIAINGQGAATGRVLGHHDYTSHGFLRTP